MTSLDKQSNSTATPKTTPLTLKTFAELNLAEPLQKALADLKFVDPTPIQTQVIPLSMQNRDLIACAETGSGKTGGYGIPIVEKLIAEPKKSALILAPTRELVHQIADFMRELTVFSRFIGVTALVGGADMRKQFQALKKNPRIVVATPGRLIDHLKRRTLKLNQTEILVLDEGDRMLDMGFSPQLDEILNYLPTQRQTSLFTATLPPKVRKLADSYLSNPIQVQVGESSRPVASIQQSAIAVPHRDKDKLIIDELNKRAGSVIIFTRTKQRTDVLAHYLEDYGFEVDLIHGGRSQGQRNRAIDNFKKGRVRILCATDVAARGIDIPKVEHVINFDLPMMDEDYVHRIGRTGRNGASGQALSFVAPDEIRLWKTLVRKFKIEGADLAGGQDSSSSRSSRSDRGGSRGGSRDGSRGGNRRSSQDKPYGSSSFGSRSSRDSSNGERSYGGERSSSSSPRSSESGERRERSNYSSSGSGERSYGGERGERSERGGSAERERSYSERSSSGYSRGASAPRGEARGEGRKTSFRDRYSDSNNKSESKRSSGFAGRAR
jgi:ATP-dependent RNA helicase DeaD